ncbi:MAG: hypothetical protein RLZZ196_3151, partial [Bacteroidota bacterium]
MKKILENITAGDLRNLIKPVFEIDSYQSKVGDDDKVSVLSFTVDGKDPAKDLEHFFEMGYNFVLDADISPGELDDGFYRVYVEIERSRHIAEQIMELVDGVKKLTNLNNLRFRYFKSFKSKDANLENLSTLPTNKKEYQITTSEKRLDNFQEFFANSFADEILLLDESISFKRIYSDKVEFDIVTSGPSKEVFDYLDGPFLAESNSMSEILFFTKYIG